MSDKSRTGAKTGHQWANPSRIELSLDTTKETECNHVALPQLVAASSSSLSSIGGAGSNSSSSFSKTSDRKLTTFHEVAVDTNDIGPARNESHAVPCPDCDGCLLVLKSSFTNDWTFRRLNHEAVGRPVMVHSKIDGFSHSWIFLHENEQVFLQLDEITVLESQKKLNEAQDYALGVGATRLQLLDAAFVVWTKNATIEDVSDRCLLVAATRMGICVSKLSSLIATLLLQLSRAQDECPEQRHTQCCCRHAVVIDDRICTWLVIDDTCSTHQNAVGLFNIVDLTIPLLQTSEIADLAFVQQSTFDVAPFEDAVPVKDFLNLTEWTTYNCESQTSLCQKRQWGHLLFLSHAWSDRDIPGSIDDLKQLQHAVREYIDRALETGPTTLVKNFETEDDFGVWLDYLVVPNDQSHANCTKCKPRKRITKMMAIPLISTTIALHPHLINRGWILHELTHNSYGNIIDIDGNPIQDRLDIDHAFRINLMLDRVDYQNGSDGKALRYQEFLRLALMPGFWPQVRLELVRALLEEGCVDERSSKAISTLFEYTRTSHRSCHNLKRAMAVQPQLVARIGVDAMTTTKGDALPKTVFDYSTFEECLRDQRKVMQEELGLSPEICNSTQSLQTMQWVSACMGLRAQLLRGAGWLHWIVLSCYTEALSTAVRAVRLHDGEMKICPASCTVSLLRHSSDDMPNEPFSMESIPASTIEVNECGVPVRALEFALAHSIDRGTSLGDQSSP